MAEVFSHVLLVFIVLTIVSWRVGWLERKWVAVGMIGAIFPDLTRFELLVPSHMVETVHGIPFGWGGLATLGGVFVLAGMGAVLFATRREQLRGFGLLLFGGMSHLLVDAVKSWADGYNGAFLYPLTWWRNPTPGLYVSADWWVFVVVLASALVVYLLDQRIKAKNPTGDVSPLTWIRGPR